MNQLLAVILTCVSAAGAVWLVLAKSTALRARWRMLRLREFVTHRGYSFESRRCPAALAERYPGHPVLGLRSATVANCIRCRLLDHDVEVFEHTYRVIVDNRPRDVMHRVLALHHMQRWPEVHIDSRRRRHACRRFVIRTLSAGLLSGEPDHERLLLDDEQFNRTFRVTTDDVDFAVLMLSPTVQSLLVRGAHRASVLVSSNDLVVIEDGPLTADAADRMLRTVHKLLDQLPADVWHLHGRDDAWRPAA